MNRDKIKLLQSKALDIRKEILTMVYRANSGHVGGSLGATDLIVALYYHLMQHDPQNPEWEGRDRFILSKGHCTPVIYAVLADCGYFPKEDLATFRRPGSHLQGHPYQPKTPGIEASTGALGLGISTGVGMALAAKREGQKHHYYILCGDGEIQEGQAWEAAMFANKYKLDNIIGFIDRNYLQTDGHSENIMPLDPLAAKWESFGWQAFIIDGHKYEEIIHTVEKAKTINRPVMIIANTVKGKGVSFMENEIIWHGKPPEREEYEQAMKELGSVGINADENRGAGINADATKQTRQGYVDALIELAAELPNLVVLDADVAKATKTEQFEKAFPDRFFNCGVQEQNMLSAAAGLALEGKIPFASTFGVFATCRAGDQLRNSIAYPKLNVKIGATHCGISTGGDGASHQANEDIAIARSLPNMTILVPGDYEEARLATKAAARFDGPVYLRFGRDNYPVVPQIHGAFEIGKAKLLRKGTDISILTTGIMVSEGLKAADELEKDGYSVRVLHLPTVKPLDVDAIVNAARETGGIVTAEEHSIIGGLGEAVAAVVAEYHPCRLHRVGVQDVFGESGHAEELLDKYGLRARDIVAAARRML